MFKFPPGQPDAGEQISKTILQARAKQDQGAQRTVKIPEVNIRGGPLPKQPTAVD